MKQFFERLRGFSERTSVVCSTVTVCVLLIVIVLNAIFFAISSLVMKARDEEWDFSLSESIDLALAPAYDAGGIEVIFCTPREELAKHSTGKYVLKTADLMEERFGDLFTFRFVNIITMMEGSERFDVSPFTKDEDGNELPILKTSVIFRSGERFRVLSSSAYEDFFSIDGAGNPVAYCGEEVFISMALWVTKGTHPTAYFTTAHSEQTDSTFARALAGAGYKIATVNLRREAVPDDCALLIISSPQSDFERSAEGSDVVAELDRIREYANGGGDIYVSLDPYLKTPLPALESFLAEYGIAISRSSVEGGSYANVVKDDSQAITTDGYTLVGYFAENDVATRLKARVRSFSDGDVLLSRCAALELSDGATPLLTSSASAALYAAGDAVDTAGSYVLAASSVRVTEDKESSLFVVPSIYMTASDAMLSNTYANKEFVYSIFEGIFGTDGDMPYGARSVALSGENLIENLTMAEARLFTVIAMLPALAAAIVGIVILKKRKNR